MGLWSYSKLGWEARVRDSRYPKQDRASLPIKYVHTFNI